MKKLLFKSFLIAISAVLVLASCKKKSEEPTPAVSNPAFSIASGTYNEPISVEITCATDGASIYYTTDGSNPSSASTKFTANISIETTTTLKAIACKDGYENSGIVEANYVIESQLDKVQTPEFVYPGGSSVGVQMVAIRCATEGATIYYTTDGTDPSDNSTQYKTSFKLTESATVKAIAYKEGMNCSNIAEVFYEITHEKVQTPTFSIAGGTFNEPVKNLTLSCATEGATIHFTLNGEEPTEYSPVYSQPLSFVETTTVKMKAFKEYYEPSDVVAQTYTIEVACSGKITVVNASGTTEYEISSVIMKDLTSLVVLTSDGSDMSLNFNIFQPGTYNFPAYQGDPDATCQAIFVYSNVKLSFINGGNITVGKDDDIYTLTFTNVSATNNNSIVPVIEQVSLSFTGVIL